MINTIMEQLFDTEKLIQVKNWKCYIDENGQKHYTINNKEVSKEFFNKYLEV